MTEKTVHPSEQLRLRGRVCFVVSDLHLGSPHFRRSMFLSFLDELPSGCVLILNGDTIDTPNRTLDAADERLLDHLVSPPRGLQTLWIRGNHEGSRLRGLPDVDWRIRLALPEVSLLITHGASFERFGVSHRFLIKSFKWLHHLRVRLGASPVHVAEYAKRWGPAYRLLCRTARKYAVACARDEGYAAITCGHVHFAEDTVVDGIRYINTGCWTGSVPHFLEICGCAIRLCEPGELGGRSSYVV